MWLTQDLTPSGVSCRLIWQGRSSCVTIFMTDGTVSKDDFLHIVDIKPDPNQLDADQTSRFFIATIALADGRVITVNGETCFKIGGCSNMPIYVGGADGTVVDTIALPIDSCITPTLTAYNDSLSLTPIWQAQDSCRNVLCGPLDTLFRPIPNPCVRHLMGLAYKNAEWRYDHYLDSIKRDFDHRYRTHCLEAAEQFSVSFKDARHHFTLYYYDQANNLVQTVPPKGVQPLTGSALAAVHDYRTGQQANPSYPSHALASVYLHNSLNQIIEQETPDGGNTNYYYDELSRIIASLNAEQNLQS